MTDNNSIAIPIITGLVVGIALIIIFSLILKLGVTPLTDSELIEKTKRLKVVQFFLQKYPDTKIIVDRSAAESGVKIYYSAERSATNLDANQDGFREKQLIVTVDQSENSNNMSVRFECHRSEDKRMIIFDDITFDTINNLCF